MTCYTYGDLVCFNDSIDETKELLNHLILNHNPNFI